MKKLMILCVAMLAAGGCIPEGGGGGERDCDAPFNVEDVPPADMYDPDGWLRCAPVHESRVLCIVGNDSATVYDMEFDGAFWVEWTVTEFTDETQRQIERQRTYECEMGEVRAMYSSYTY